MKHAINLKIRSMRNAAYGIKNSWRSSITDNSESFPNKELLRGMDHHDFLEGEISHLEELVNGEKKSILATDIMFITSVGIISLFGIRFEFMNWQSIAIMIVSGLLYKTLNWVIRCA